MYKGVEYPQWFIDELAPEFRDLNFRIEDKVGFVCEKHGIYYQKVYSHIKKTTGERRRGCPHCAHLEYRIREIPEWAINEMAHEEDREEARKGIISTSKKVDWVCEKHGIYTQEFGRHVNMTAGIPRNRCPKCMIGNYRSRFELSVEEWCLDHGWELGPRKGVIRSPEGRPMELDIYLPNQKVAIECDGDIWHGEGEGKEDPYGRTRWIGYHKWKDDKCKEIGIKLFHILYSEWKNKSKRKKIYSEIESYIKV